MSICMNKVSKTYDWNQFIQEEQQKDYFKSIKRHIAQQISQGIIVYPQTSDYFKALNLTPFDAVKVVIIGQDPYHNPNQANGLCFSVPEGAPRPPSLKNIVKAVEMDIGQSQIADGDLTPWAKQGVLLLNSALSVEAYNAGSHSNIGWETFTDHVIQLLNRHSKPIIYLLWGKHAQKKLSLITHSQHHFLTAPHPSPLSAHRGFFTCCHFSKTNTWLTQNGRTPIDW